MSIIKLDMALSVVVISIVITFLPSSPFSAFLNATDTIDTLVNLRYVNFFVPFSQMIAVGQAWLLCVSIYYMYMYIMRFVRLIK